MQRRQSGALDVARDAPRAGDVGSLVRAAGLSVAEGDRAGHRRSGPEWQYERGVAPETTVQVRDAPARDGPMILNENAAA